MKNSKELKDLRVYLKESARERIALLLDEVGLSECERKIILLRYKDKISLSKVAEITFSNPSSVSKKCSVALRQILDYFHFKEENIRNVQK